MKTPPLLLITLLNVASLFADDGKPIFADDFENRTELGAAYTVKSDWAESFKVTNGKLVISQVNPNHGAVLRKDIPFKDLDLEFDLRFNGGTSFNLVINDQNEKSVWSGHVSRVVFTPKKLSIKDDKKGSMNLEVRKQRLDKNLSAEKKKALEDLLAETETNAKVDLKPNEWHHVRVRIIGDRMDAWIAGNKVAELTSPGIAHPTKTSFGFTVTGTSIDFDNIKMVEAIAGTSEPVRLHK
ncbi:MAG: DUF1080 domain-containing protein [Verrucomicrobiales bacterium]|nr:DUF1080 domain-containing protein [Verrucomicrobiales bacterium]